MTTITDAVQNPRRDEDGNVLVISATPGLVAKWLIPRLWRFLRAYPDIDARVSATMKLVDFSTDGVDVAIRLSKQAAPDLHDEKLFEDSMLPDCAPRLVEQGLRSAADLARFPLIHYDFATSMHTPPVWADWFPVAGLKGADITRGLRVNGVVASADLAGAEGPCRFLVSDASAALSGQLLRTTDSAPD